MSKLYATLTAATLAMSLSGFAVAQQDDAKKQEEYQAALKKCEPLQGADRQKCFEEA
jgi:hypothetical protein